MSFLTANEHFNVLKVFQQTCESQALQKGN